MENEIPYYPEVLIRSFRTTLYGTEHSAFQYHYEVLTNLRKKHNKKWYLFRFWKTFVTENENDFIEFLNRFHKEVYRTLLLGKINTKLKNSVGLPIFPLDILQISEEERIKSTIL